VPETRTWRLIDRTLRFPPPAAAGIVNVTDDSFFAGARSVTPDQAIADGLALVEAGFDLLDVGAVAARSGPPVDPADEAARLIPAVSRLAADADVPVLVDTFSAPVARAAVEAGAAAINDISGGADPALFEVAAESGCGYVLMHIEGPPRADRRPPGYEDPVAHLTRWFAERLERATEAGVDPEQVVLDPGLDFDLSVADDLEILRRLDELHALDRPLFIAISRKDFLGAVLAGSWEERLAPEDREGATLAATALATAAGAELHRLHDASSLDAMRVAAAIAHA
jgi:dihydropteroate synthase